MSEASSVEPVITALSENYTRWKPSATIVGNHIKNQSVYIYTAAYKALLWSDIWQRPP